MNSRRAQAIERGTGGAPLSVQKKVLVKEKLAPEGVKYLEDLGFQVDVGTEWDADELLSRIPEYHGLIIRSATQVTEEVLAAAEDLLVVGRAGIGLDNVDVEAATARGVMVANAPQSNTLSTAEHTMAMILAMAAILAGCSSTAKQDVAKTDGASAAEKPAKKLTQPSMNPHAGPHASERYTYSPPDRGKLAPSSA